MISVRKMEERIDGLADALEAAWGVYPLDNTPEGKRRTWTGLADTAIRLLGAQPGPVACDPLTVDDLDSPTVGALAEALSKKFLWNGQHAKAVATEALLFCGDRAALRSELLKADQAFAELEGAFHQAIANGAQSVDVAAIEREGERKAFQHVAQEAFEGAGQLEMLDKTELAACMREFAVWAQEQRDEAASQEAQPAPTESCPACGGSFDDPGDLAEMADTGMCVDCALKQLAPDAPAKTATPALDAYLDSSRSDDRPAHLIRAAVASDAAGLLDELKLERARTEMAREGNEAERALRVKAEFEVDKLRGELEAAKVSAVNWQTSYDKACRERDECKAELAEAKKALEVALAQRDAGREACEELHTKLDALEGQPAPQEGTPLVVSVVVEGCTVLVQPIDRLPPDEVYCWNEAQAAAIADVLRRARIPEAKEPTP